MSPEPFGNGAASKVSIVFERTVDLLRGRLRKLLCRGMLEMGFGFALKRPVTNTYMNCCHPSVGYWRDHIALPCDSCVRSIIGSSFA